MRERVIVVTLFVCLLFVCQLLSTGVNTDMKHHLLRKRKGTVELEHWSAVGVVTSK